MSDLRIVFGGDRYLAVKILRFILDQGVKPLGLMLPDQDKASHAKELGTMCHYLSPDRIWYGKSFRSPEGIATLQSLDLDYILCIHLPVIIPKAVLDIPREGVVNLHPAFLPYNRGWHPSLWALHDETPYGATLHFMNEGLDTGDIILQHKVLVTPMDTGDSLYKKALELEYEVFQEAWSDLVNFSYKRIQQPLGGGTAHKMRDLYESGMQQIDLDAQVRTGDFIRKLRAMTTNNIDEACYFETGGSRYRVQIKILKDT